MIRVMIVEDSPTARELLVNALETERDIEVAGTAKNGAEAVAAVQKINPDIILMDINLPGLNGFQASKKIMEEHPVPILLVTASWSIDEVKNILESIDIGVLGVYEKPHGLGHPRFQELLDEIVTAVRVMSDVKVVRRWGEYPAGFSKPKLKTIPETGKRLVVIGASTGGPPVLHMLLASLPPDYPLPILVVQHMSRGFIDSFVEWLSGNCALKVKKAEGGERIAGRCVYIAPDQYHMTLDGETIRFLPACEGELFVPSISRLFASLLKEHGADTVAILLSGMGSDGAAEIGELKKKGAVTVAQNEASSVIFGMAKTAIEYGAIDYVLSPAEIAAFLLDMGSCIKDRR